MNFKRTFVGRLLVKMAESINTALASSHDHSNVTKSQNPHQ